MTRVVFMGTPAFAVPSLAALIREGYDVVGVLTRPDSPAGRGRRLEESPVKHLARAEGLAIQQPITLRSPQAQEALAALKPDLIVVAAYGLILPQEVLDLPKQGCVNVHASLLPRHRGAAPVTAAILAGDEKTGVTLMLMDAGLDTGPVLAHAAVPVAPDDTTGSLTEHLAGLGARLLVDTLPGWLNGLLTPVPQPEEGVTLAPRIEKRDGWIDWTEAAETLARRVRAYQPWPSCYTHWRGQVLKVLRADAGKGPEGDPGRVVTGEENGVGVLTGDGVLWLHEVQLSGRRTMPAGTFVRGAPGFVGDHLGNPSET